MDVLIIGNFLGALFVFRIAYSLGSDKEAEQILLEFVRWSWNLQQKWSRLYGVALIKRERSRVSKFAPKSAWRKTVHYINTI